MIFNAWPDSFTAKQGSKLPSSYLCFDTEFTGSNRDKDLILEIGHTMVENNQVVDTMQLVLNWFAFPGVDASWLEYKINSMRNVIGPSWRFSRKRLEEEGIDPLKALNFYDELFSLWSSRELPFVGQNGLQADEPMLRSNFLRYLNKTFSIPDDQYYDVGGLYKVFKVWNNPESYYRNMVIPSKNEKLKGYFERICNAKFSGLRWSLKQILEEFQLFHKHNIARSELHGAAFDSLCVHYVLQEYRELLDSAVVSEEKPERNSTVVQPSVVRRARGFKRQRSI